VALVFTGMSCALCRKPIDDPMHDTFATTMWGMDDLRFAVLDDSACHQVCIDRWKLRDEFIEYYNRNCKNELYVDRKGHVAYRFDYANWISRALTFAFGVVFCLPSLALLELNFQTRTSRVGAFLLPYALLATLIAFCAIRWTFQLALLIGLISWATVTICALLAVVYPVIRERLRSG